MYSVEPLTWQIPAYDGIAERNIVGTIEDVMGAISDLPLPVRQELLDNSTIIWADSDSAARALEAGKAELPQRDANGNAAIGDWPELEKPSSMAFTGYWKRETVKLMCLLRRHPTAEDSAVLRAIDNVRRKTNPKRPTNGPGPGKCSLASCYRDAAIYWCNDVSSLGPASWLLCRRRIIFPQRSTFIHA